MVRKPREDEPKEAGAPPQGALPVVRGHQPFPSGGGEMGELIRSMDWSRTPIGPAEVWSPALRMVVNLMMANRFPMVLWWGPQFVQLYNDPYRPIPGDKHPRSMGQLARECWCEIWHVIGPLIETPFRGGPATWMEDILLEINRHGFVEETHFTIAYSPVPDETAPNGIGGVLATVHEITGKVVGDRRILALRDLGAGSAEARTAEENCVIAAQTLAKHPKDVPFAALYLVDPDGRRARLAGTAGIEAGHPASPAEIALDGGEADSALWPLSATRQSEVLQIVTGLPALLGNRVPAGPWSDPPSTAAVVPIRSTRAYRLAGFLVAGISPRLRFDSQYRDFLELVTSQIGNGIANARSYEEEKRRAEALAEVDRAKPTFFSNVSNEFRTPLAWMPGPRGDLVADSEGRLPSEDREQIASETRFAPGDRLPPAASFGNPVPRPKIVLADEQERERLTKELEERVGELHAVLDAAPIGIWIAHDPECNSITGNAYANRLMQVPPGGNVSCSAGPEHVAVSYRVLRGGKELQPAEMPAQLAAATGKPVPSEALEIRFADGRSVHLLEAAVPLLDGEGRVRGAIAAAADVSQLTRVEEALRAAEELAHQRLAEIEDLYRNAPVGLCVLDRDLRFLRINERLAEINGIPAADHIGKTVRAVLPALADVVEPGMRRILKTGEPRLDVEIVSETPARPGVQRVWLEQWLPIKDFEGRVTGLSIVVEEITARKQAEQDLRRLANELELERGRLQAVFENMEEAVGLWSADGKLVSVNDATVRLYGFETKEQMLKHLSEYADVKVRTLDGRELPQEEWPPARVLRGESFSNWELEQFIPSINKRFIGSNSGSPVRDASGNIVLGVVALHDITALHDARRAAERNLQERERLLEEVRTAEKWLRMDLEAMTRLQQVGSLFLQEGNLEEVLSEIIDAAISISGADFGDIQIIDAKSLDLKIAAQRGFPEWWMDCWDCVPRGQGACGVAFERGARVIVEDVEQSPPFVGTEALEVQLRAGVRAVQSTPLVSRSGRPLGVLSTHWKTPGRPDQRLLSLLDLLGRQAADIIERAQNEEALRAANAQLLEADRRKNQFLAMLSHELRNPLAPIKNSLYVLDRAVPGGDQARRAQEVISRQADQLARLVDDLLDVTRITRGKIQLQRQRLELNELVCRAIDDHRSDFAKQEVALELVPAASPLYVNGDRNRLAQVIGNLLQNAAKFTGRKGVTRIAVETDGAARRAIVRVTDTGIGMTQQMLSRLFEPFSQADETLDRSKGGLGLGLALVKGLAELHDGDVSAHSEGLGRGAEFTVRLPLDLPGSAQSEMPKEQTGRFRRRVLIIEDNVDAAGSLSEVLELGDHEVEVAYNGPEGITKAQEFRPEVVLCDIGLPGMDGYQVARALRADTGLKGTFLVALTGYALPEDLQRAAEAGFERHLAKPLSPEKLEQLLNELR